MTVNRWKYRSEKYDINLLSLRREFGECEIVLQIVVEIELKIVLKNIKNNFNETKLKKREKIT